MLTQPKPPLAFASRRTLILIIVLLTLLLRLAFIFHVSKIRVIWDTEEYWNTSLLLRNTLCTTFRYCTPTESIQQPAAFFFMGAISHDGFLPLLTGSALSIFPPDVRVVYILFTLLECLCSVFIIDIVLRLKGPFMVAALAGFLNAIYIPTIIETGTLFQQPLIRFCLTLTIWAYMRAFTAKNSKLTSSWCVIATLGTFLTGFNTPPLRPLMWLIWAFIILFGLVRSEYRTIARTQSRLLVVVIVILMAQVVILRLMGKREMTDTTSFIFTGLSATGTITGQTTPVMFPNFWPPTHHSRWFLEKSPGVLKDFTRDPGQFVYWWVYSFVGNWRYPENVYFQGFILDLEGQKVQHVIFFLFGVIGLAWLSGGNRNEQAVSWLALFIGLYVTAAFAVISVEPRRLTILVPVLLVGSAYGLWVLVRYLNQYRNHLPDILLWVVTVVVLALPLGMFTAFLPINTSYIALVVLRTSLVLICVIRLLNLWKRQNPQYLPVIPVLLLIGSVGVFGIVQFQDTEWRAWTAPSTTRVRQEITDLQPPEHLWPWIIIDVASAQEAAALTLSVNGQTIKPAEMPMYVWEAGMPPVASSYPILWDMANYPPPRAMWYAYPVSPDLLTTEPIEVELTANGNPITVKGDYIDQTSDTYRGPSFNPWLAGQSLWLWQWNALDPRIPAPEVLHGQRYTSARWEGDHWISADLSSEVGVQSGIYRVFVVYAAFGWPTDALMIPGEVTALPPAKCPQGVLISNATVESRYFICQLDDRSLNYYADGSIIATFTADITTKLNLNQYIKTIDVKQGHLEIVQVQYQTFVANFYSADNQLIHSTAFTVLP